MTPWLVPLSATGGANWPIATCYPSLPFPRMEAGGGRAQGLGI